MKQEKNGHIHDLCSAIDQAMGRQMQSPKDFDMLGEHISARLGKTISSSTLKVVASVATRLQPGDSFQCSVIIEGEPLFLTNLQQPGRPVTNYVCGRNGGIRFER